MKIDLDVVNLDADDVIGDRGWEYWKRERDVLSEHSTELLGPGDEAGFEAHFSARMSTNKLQVG